MYSYCSRIFGLPHSSNSPTVSGSDSSSIVLITSTKGTRSTAAAQQVRAQVEHRAHEQAARAAALDDEPVGRGVAAPRPGSSAAAMKSVNVLRLFIMRPVVVPALAQLAAAADVGDRDDDPAVEQAQAVRREAAG